MAKNILNCKNKDEFREWLKNNGHSEQECFLKLKRGRPVEEDTFYYIDAVEVALCFGWIDSTNSLVNGERYQRFSKRSKNSHWTMLNCARAERLKSLGLMTNEGLAVVPKIEEIIIEKDKNEIMEIIKKENLESTFSSFPLLYQQIRLSNLIFYKHHSKLEYEKALTHFIEKTKKHELYGEWNDYGRLK